MAEHGLHRGLELRLQALAERIAALRQKMNQASGPAKIEAFGEVERFEQRYKELAGRLDALNREGPGFHPKVKAEWEKIADDLTGTIANFTTWVDSGYRAGRQDET
jgi:hypothetical protein